MIFPQKGICFLHAKAHSRRDGMGPSSSTTTWVVLAGRHITHKKVQQSRRKRLRVPTLPGMTDRHRLFVTTQKPDYCLCCSLMLALGLRTANVFARDVQSNNSTQIIVLVTGKGNRCVFFSVAQPMSETISTIFQYIDQKHSLSDNCIVLKIT